VSNNSRLAGRATSELKTAPSGYAGGQTLRLPGAAPNASLYDQLYRYAEDLQQLVDRHGELEHRHNEMIHQYEQLGEHRDMLDRLINASRDMHIVTDLDGTILYCNASTAAIASPDSLIGFNLIEWVLPSYRPVYMGLCEGVMQGGMPPTQGETELRFHQENANTTFVIVLAQVLASQVRGGTRHLHWLMRNVTSQREAEFETQLSAMVFRSANEGVMITDLSGVILTVNPAFTRITGYSCTEVVGRRPSLLSSGVQGEDFYKEFWRSLTEKGSWQGRIYNRKKTGEIYPEWLTVSSARDTNGQILSYIAVFNDLSKLLEAEQQLSELANHDSLTGLPNRLLLRDRLTQTIVQARRTGIAYTVIFIDLDRFKPINDLMGHDVGDQVLIEVARRLRTVIREVDTVARVGGDEFVVLAPALGGDADIGMFCEKLLATLAAPFILFNEEVFIGASCGCAEYPRHGENDQILLKHADDAMYRSKHRGGNTYTIYSSISEVQSTHMIRLETDLRHALERGELRLEYQPQVRATGGGVTGVEALLRWDHPSLGTLLPNQFISLSEQIGLIIPIGSWALAEACRQLVAWDREGLPALTMALNVSPRQLRDPGFVNIVRQTLVASGVAPERIELEITESELMLNHDLDITLFNRLRSIGVRIALADFGSMYASLALLAKVPVDRLKIDQGFVAALERSGRGQARDISAAIVAMGQAIGLSLVAEGVESNQVHSIMAQGGCQVIQGFFTGYPMCPEDLAMFVRKDAGMQATPHQETSA
jgi:diguanylate cyclase (GGDEF)-like protein/PAS domain S-box-containing protein